MATVDLCNHWTEMPEWYSGRRLWAFYLTFDGQPELQARVRADQEALQAVGGFDLIAPENLHLSVQGVAFKDQVDAARMDDLAATVREAVKGQRLSTLLAVRAQIDFDAVSLPVFPVQEIEGVKKLVHDVAVEILGPDCLYRLPESPGGFSPHISIAYANTYISSDRLSAGMRNVSSEITPINVNEVSLVALSREDHRWTWDSETRFALNEPARSAVYETRTTTV